jgi:hypothetical protein
MNHDIAPAGRPGEVEELLRWDGAGLVTVVAQAHDTGEVLMVAWADRAALRQTLATGIPELPVGEGRDQRLPAAGGGGARRLRRRLPALPRRRAGAGLPPVAAVVFFQPR